MAIKLKIPKTAGPVKKGKLPLPRDPVVRAVLLVFLSLAIVVVGAFSYFYVKYDRVIVKRFSSPVFSNSARIYANPKVVRPGQGFPARAIAAELKHAGYSEKGEQSPMGSYRLLNDGIEVTPGPESYHSPDPARIVIRDGKVASITSRGSDLAAYELEPQLVTALFDAEQRSKRQLVKYDDIPKVMVDAVLAIEDRRFFQHGGVNFLRLAQAFWVDVTRQRHEQGGSTITMQLSRAFFLTPEKTVKRKLSEIMIALELEQKFSKQQIFEFYANRVDLGQRGSFTISGFAEASRSPRDICYLNAASWSPLPIAAQEAGRAGVGRKGQPWSLDAGFASRQYERAQRAAASVINADAEDVALIPSVSYGVATAAKVLSIAAGAGVLLLHNDHSSAVLEWMTRAPAGRFTIDVVPQPEDGNWTTAVLAAIERPRAPPVALASISSVHWSDGAMVDMERVAPALRRQGAALVIDATHAAGVIRTDVRSLDPDFLV
ncbi:MAG TPA: aminotransferase class V-fold PLP-dependent enzyme, partial [Terriglobales bacterium]|nr:aminotransferase class V-fold PLP-dependent enzyme [Terriglobales bacterium]